MENKEPSNQTLLESINERFNMVFEELQKNQVRFGAIYKHLTSLLQGQQELKDGREADRELLDEIGDTVKTKSKAVDADAMTLVRHDRRITNIEKIFR